MPSVSDSPSSPKRLSKETILRASTLAFAVEALTLPEGRWDFENRPYQIDPLIDPAPEQVWEKGTQVGCTVLAFAKGSHGLTYEFPLGLGVFLPTQGEMTRFEKTKVSRMTRGSPILKPQDVIEDKSAADNTQLKRMGRSFLYLVGLKTEAGVRSFSIDMAIIDEVDAIDAPMRRMVRDRMGNSAFKRVIELSRPTLEDYGIDERFLESDQHFWVTKCPGCTLYSAAEEDFPENMIEAKGTVSLGCPSCHRPIDIRSGEWIAKMETNALRGYHFSQILNPMTDLKELLHDYRTTKYPDIFHRSRLGLPFTPKEGGLSKSHIFACCAHRVLSINTKRGGCTMGIDVGTDLHVVVSWPGPMGIRVTRLLKRKWSDIGALIASVKPWRVVIDAMPELEKAKELAEQFPGTVYRCWYRDTLTTDPVWDHVSCQVEANRTMSLDVATREIVQRKRIWQARDELVEELAVHAVKLAKIQVADKHGNIRYVWEGKPDHYRHALNYDSIAGMESQPSASWL